MGVGYFAFIDTDLVRGADAHPAIGGLRQETPGPLGKTHPVSAVGKAVAEGIERRKRWVTVPRWLGVTLHLRTALAPLLERGAFERAAEADRLIQQDIDERGVEESSAPVGAGGKAARERETA